MLRLLLHTDFLNVLLTTLLQQFADNVLNNICKLVIMAEV